MKKLLLILMLIIGSVTITSRPVTTYAYTEAQKQQAKSWLSAHGYAPTRAGAEQAYQDYMDGKISVPEADEYLGRNKQKKAEAKNNNTEKTNKTSRQTEEKKSTNNINDTEKNKDNRTSTSNTTKTTTEITTKATTETKSTTETKQVKKQKAEKKKQEQKKEKKKHATGIAIAAVAIIIFGLLVVILRKKI